jgi:hypothetical protein
MASPGVGLSSSTTNQPALTNLLEQKLRAERVVKAGASWFLMVAVLSLINSALSMSGAGIRFIFGLGIAQFVDAIAHQAGQTGFALDFIINGFVAAVFVFFWNFAKRGDQWAFVAGMSLYILDALLMLSFHDVLAVGFHGYALYRIYRGMNGIRALRHFEAQLQPAGAPIQPR